MTDTAAATAAPDESDLRARLARLGLEQKVRLLTGADSFALHAEPAAGLRRVVTSDGPAGVRGEHWDERETSANVPSPTALASTWDPERIEQVGRLLAAESRRKGVDVLLAPTVNLHRTPFGGRHFECLSEDPYLSAVIGAAYVRGLQAGGVAATVKHFVANDTETQRLTLDAVVGERVLRELYLVPFEVLVRQAGAWAVMAAYNQVNGTTMTEHPMLRDVLQGEWGFDGLTMSDWGATRSVTAAGSGGLDLAMPGPASPWVDGLVAAVRAGEVPEAAVDDKVLRLLRLAARVGALDGIAPAAPAAAPWSDEEVAAQARDLAARGFVLVRNEGLLPLAAADLRRVALVGPNAVVARTLGGGSATVYPAWTVSPLDGLRSALGESVEVVTAEGVRTATRAPAADPAALRTPDGAEGVLVRVLGADGSVLAQEVRRAGSFIWLGVIAGVPVSGADAVEVVTTLTASRAGRHQVGCSGEGRFALSLAGEQVFDEQLVMPPGSDPIERMIRPPQRLVGVDLSEGQQLDLVLRHRVSVAAGVEPTVAIGVNHVGPYDGDSAELDWAVRVAAEADAAVVVVGTTEEVESEGFDRESLALPGRQDELVRLVVTANPRTVVVVNSGAPVLLPWADEVPAVLLTWFPGQEFGSALADVLLGLREPGGRLPVTWPAVADGLPATQPVDGRVPYDEGLHVGYRWYQRVGREPAFPFGAGLGYTTWEFVSADAPAQIGAGSDATARVVVRNTGERGGRAVVQAYLSRAESALERATLWLAGFAAVEVAPGNEAVVDVVIPARQFSHWDVAAHAWAYEPGEFQLRIGPSSGDLPLTATVAVG